MYGFINPLVLLIGEYQEVSMTGNTFSENYHTHNYGSLLYHEYKISYNCLNCDVEHQFVNILINLPLTRIQYLTTEN
jgi:hypothetical protein